MRPPTVPEPIARRASSKEAGLLIAAATLFCLSGIAALIYQVTWQRILALHSGMGIYSVAMIVAFAHGRPRYWEPSRGGRKHSKKTSDRHSQLGCSCTR